MPDFNKEPNFSPFVMTAILVVVSAVLYAVVHFALKDQAKKPIVEPTALDYKYGYRDGFGQGACLATLEERGLAAACYTCEVTIDGSATIPYKKSAVLQGVKLTPADTDACEDVE